MGRAGGVGKLVRAPGPGLRRAARRSERPDEDGVDVGPLGGVGRPPAPTFGAGLPGGGTLKLVYDGGLGFPVHCCVGG